MNQTVPELIKIGLQRQHLLKLGTPRFFPAPVSLAFTDLNNFSGPEGIWAKLPSLISSEPMKSHALQMGDVGPGGSWSQLLVLGLLTTAVSLIYFGKGQRRALSHILPLYIVYPLVFFTLDLTLTVYATICESSIKAQA